MLDVFLAAFLSGAVKFGAFGLVQPRIGIVAFRVGRGPHDVSDPIVRSANLLGAWPAYPSLFPHELCPLRQSFPHTGHLADLDCPARSPRRRRMADLS